MKETAPKGLFQPVPCGDTGLVRLVMGDSEPMGPKLTPEEAAVLQKHLPAFLPDIQNEVWKAFTKEQWVAQKHRKKPGPPGPPIYAIRITEKWGVMLCRFWDTNQRKCFMLHSPHKDKQKVVYAHEMDWAFWDPVTRFVDFTRHNVVYEIDAIDTIISYELHRRNRKVVRNNRTGPVREVLRRWDVPIVVLAERLNMTYAAIYRSLYSKRQLISQNHWKELASAMVHFRVAESMEEAENVIEIWNNRPLFEKELDLKEKNT